MPFRTARRLLHPVVVTIGRGLILAGLSVAAWLIASATASSAAHAARTPLVDAASTMTRGVSALDGGRGHRPLHRPPAGGGHRAATKPVTEPAPEPVIKPVTEPAPEPAAPGTDTVDAGPLEPFVTPPGGSVTGPRAAPSQRCVTAAPA